MTKDQFVLFLKENPQYQQYFVKNVFDTIWGKYAIKKNGEVYSVIYYDDFRGGTVLFTGKNKEKVYDFLVCELRKNITG